MIDLEAGVDLDLLVEDIGPKPSALGRVRDRVRGDVVVVSAVGLVVIGTFFGGFFGFLATTIVAGFMLAAKFHDDPRVRASREGKRYLAAIAEADARRTRLRRVVATIASTHAKVDRKRVAGAEVERVEAVPRAGVGERYARGRGGRADVGQVDVAQRTLRAGRGSPRCWSCSIPRSQTMSLAASGSPGGSVVTTPRRRFRPASGSENPPGSADPSTFTATTRTALEVGSVHVCGLRGEGEFWCWGEGREGALGLGNVVFHSRQDVVPGP